VKGSPIAPRRSFHPPPRAASAGAAGSVSPLNYFETRLDLDALTPKLLNTIRSPWVVWLGFSPGEKRVEILTPYPNAPATDPDLRSARRGRSVANCFLIQPKELRHLGTGQKLAGWASCLAGRTISSESNRAKITLPGAASYRLRSPELRPQIAQAIFKALISGPNVHGSACTVNRSTGHSLVAHAKKSWPSGRSTMWCLRSRISQGLSRSCSVTENPYRTNTCSHSQISRRRCSLGS